MTKDNTKPKSSRSNMLGKFGAATAIRDSKPAKPVVRKLTPPAPDALSSRAPFDPVSGKDLIFRGIALSQIKILPQVRRRIDESSEEFLELVNDIRENGLHQPVTVVSGGLNEYYLLMGERRLRAFRALAQEDPAKWGYIPANVRPAISGADFSNEENWTSEAKLQWVRRQMSENTKRQNLSALDTVYGVQLMTKLSGSSKSAAEAMGKSSSWVSQRLSAAEGLTPEIIEYAERTDMRDALLLYSLVKANEKHPEETSALMKECDVSMASLRRLDEPKSVEEESPKNEEEPKEPKPKAEKKPRIVYTVAFRRDGTEIVGWLDTKNKKLRLDAGEVFVKVEGEKKGIVLKADEVRLLGATELPGD